MLGGTGLSSPHSKYMAIIPFSDDASAASASSRSAVQITDSRRRLCCRIRLNAKWTLSLRGVAEHSIEWMPTRGVDGSSFVEAFIVALARKYLARSSCTCKKKTGLDSVHMRPAETIAFTKATEHPAHGPVSYIRQSQGTRARDAHSSFG